MSFVIHLFILNALQSQITKLENTVDMCKATGDPHYTTFDGKYVPSLSYQVCFIFEDKVINLRDKKVALYTIRLLG